MLRSLIKENHPFVILNIWNYITNKKNNFYIWSKIHSKKKIFLSKYLILWKKSNPKKIWPTAWGKGVIINIIFLGLYFPKEPGYDGKFFLQVLTGNKLVIQAHIILILVNPARSHRRIWIQILYKRKKNLLKRIFSIDYWQLIIQENIYPMILNYHHCLAIFLLQ